MGRRQLNLPPFHLGKRKGSGSIWRHPHSPTGREKGVSFIFGATNIAYRPMNLAMSAWNSANGLRNVNAYDDDMRLIGIRVPNLQSWDYGYDTANRIKTITDNLDGTLSQTLGYDELNRLTSVTSTADNESFTYDADGNRLTAQINGTAWTYTPDASNNRLDSFVAQGANPVYLQYDAQGNLTFYGGPLNASMYSIDGDLPPQPGIVYHFNSFNRMDSTSFNGTATSFDVNPEGQRLPKYTSTNSTWFAPDVSGTLLAEDQDGTWSDYVWLNGKLVGMIRNGNVYSVHTDQTGRPEGMSNSQGTVVWRAKNYAFDREVTAGQASGFNLGFPGQYNDPEVGDYWYNGYRDYSALLGRYLESDPVGLLGGINTYTYAGNNPVSYIDPLGLAYQVAENYSFTVITPWVGVTVNISTGISFDGWNTRTFSQGQLSTGINSAGFFVGLGSGYSFGHGESPTTGLSSNPYIEADIDALLGLGGSATKDACGNIDWSLSKGFKGSIGAGVGGFSGTSYSATGVSPTLGSIFGH